MKRSKNASEETEKTSAPRRKVRKLAPTRPFPIVPLSVSATGPRSAHQEGKNYICITRKTPLGQYLRRCKEAIMRDDCKILHLHALGAAIPHLARLAVSLPPILPYPASEIQTKVYTGTEELRDEVIPDDEEEDISIQTREKSTMHVVIRIGNGDIEEQGDMGARESLAKEKKEPRTSSEQLVFQEGDEDNDSSK